jgi:hypothetical protein
VANKEAAVGNAHFEKWRSLVEEFRDKARKLEMDEHNNCVARTLDERTRVAEAQQFMETSGIGDALCSVIWTVRRFAAWSCGRHASSVPCDYSNVEFQADNLKDFAVSFTYRGWRNYGLTFRELSAHLDPREDSRGQAYLLSNGVAVFGTSMISRPGAEYDDWQPTTVEAFRPGEWIADLLEMHSEQKRAKQASRTQQLNEMTSRRASMISLE